MDLIPFENLRPASIRAEDYVVFGGTFDPIHEGHVSVVRRLRVLFPSVTIAPTEANPWKREAPTSAELRREMIELVLEAEGFGEQICVSEFPYSYSEELVDHLRERHDGNLYWAVGADNADSVKDWRNWSSKNVPTIVLPIEVDAHAVLVRLGKAKAHPAIQDFIRERNLYEHS